jgi:serine/threonine protein kinase
VWDNLSADRAVPSGATSLEVDDLILERYRAIEQIAEGGQSVVWRVKDERLDRLACAKVFNGAALEASVRKVVERGFLDEAFLLARLAHPSALQILDFGFFTPPLGGRLATPVQICELVENGTLTDWMRNKGALAPAEVLGLLMPVASVLAELHDMGFVHLDVKPQNILLRVVLGERHAKLADFGIARPIGTTAVGGDGVLMYSVNWASPEQLVGDRLGPESDVYSLALVALNALTGKPLFREPDPDQGYRLRRYAAELIADALAEAELPDSLALTFQEACHFDAEMRIKNVHEFAHRLQAGLGLLRGRPAAPAPFNWQPAPEASRAIATPLWSLALDQPCPTVAGRQLAFVRLAPSADLSVARGTARLRLSLLASAADRSTLHVQGLNCFVRLAGGRASAAITLERGAAIELCSPTGARLAGADVVFAAAGPRRSLLTLEQERLIVAAAEGPLLMVDFGRHEHCFLVHGDARPRPMT